MHFFNTDSSSREYLLKICNSLGAACFLAFVPYHYYFLRCSYLGFTSLITGCFILVNAFVLSKYYSFKLAMNLNLVVAFLQILNFSFFLGSSFDPSLCWFILFLSVCIVFLETRTVWFWIIISLIVFPFLCYLKRTPLSHYQIIFTHNQWQTAFYLNYFMFILSCAVLFYFFSETVQKSYNEAKKANEYLTELIRIIGHDINNPLTVIKGYVEMIDKDSRLTGLQVESLMKIKNESCYIQNIISKIRDWKAIESGKKEVVVKAIKVLDLMNISVDLVGHKAWKKNITMNLSTIDENTYVWGNQEILVHKVLKEVLDNALKYSFPKSSIDIGVISENRIVKIRIQDQGVGIEKSRLSRIFTFDLGCLKKGTEGEGGTGFALPLAFIFLKKMKGEIRVESKIISDGINHGTLFEIILQKCSVITKDRV